jgi:hypothetical protein
MTKTKSFTRVAAGTATILALLLAVGCATPNAGGRLVRMDDPPAAPGTSACAAFGCEP